MLTATAGIDAPLIFNASVDGLTIYLDNFAVIRLATQNPIRRKRLVTAFRSGVDLLFSVTNAIELIGPQGDKVDVIKTFLDEIGAHWIPVEMNPYKVLDREQAGCTGNESCVSSEFMIGYFKTRTADYTSDSGHIIDLSKSFFSLGAVLEWLGTRRASVGAQKAELDDSLIRTISQHRSEFDRDPQWLDHKFTAVPFFDSKPATFTYLNLVRTLILEAKSHRLKKGDGTDFCHAVIASSFASIATLDKHWKRRIESLPKPNKLARIYYQPQLDQMVDDIDTILKSRSNRAQKI